MALLSFPVSPFNGEIYPVSPPALTNIYQWSSAENTWVLLGKSTGVAAGTYGTPLSVPQITVDAAGRITVAVDVPIQLGNTAQIGLVQLVDDTISDDPTKALTAAQGYKLQNEIGDVNNLSPFYPNLVTAINALGAPTGVTPGTYGNGSNVSSFTVNAQGRITSATNVPLSVATTSSPGVVRIGANLNITGTGLLSVPNASTSVTGAVRLVNNTVTNDATKALTAAMGYSLQQQIDQIDLESNLTLAGTLNAATGLLLTVTTTGISKGFSVGQPLPPPLASNAECFVIVAVSGNYTPPGGISVSASVGDWFLSDGVYWEFINVGYAPPIATTTTTGVVQIGANINVNPAGVISVADGTTTTKGIVQLVNNTTTNDPTKALTAAAGYNLQQQLNAISQATLVQLDDIEYLFDGTQTIFPLTIGGVPYTPASAGEVLISLGGVVQIPGEAFTISGSSIDFSDPPETDTSFVGYVAEGGSGGGGGGGGIGTVTSVDTGTGLTGGPIVSTGTISLKVATTTSLGGVIPDGTSISISPSGVISTVTPSVYSFVYLDDISSQFNGTLKSFALKRSGTLFTPSPISNLMVVLGGVPQPPSGSYSVSGSTITFSEAPATGATFIGITVGI